MNLSPLLIVTIVFSILYLVMVLYFFIGWVRLKKSQEPITNNQEAQLPSVSIIIPVRNESENIKQCLESIFKQNYPEDLLEVVVIDDYSTDTTLQLAKEFKEPNFKVFDLMQYLKEA